MVDRTLIENAVEALLAILDRIDGDPDLEPEHDLTADDAGEIAGETWLEPAMASASVRFTA